METTLLSATDVVRTMEVSAADSVDKIVDIQANIGFTSSLNCSIVDCMV